MDNSRFIAEVKARVALWDPSTTFYRNKALNTQQWNEIAEMFGVDVFAAKQKWKNLRDTFRVELKKVARSAEDDPNSEPIRSCWNHYNDMLFLKSILRTRPSGSAIDDYSEVESLETSSRVKIEDTISFSPSNIEDELPEPETSSNFEEFPMIPSRLPVSIHAADRGLRSKRKRTNSEDGGSEIFNDNDTDDDILFFRSLLPYIKKLPENKKLMFRMNVQQALYNELYN